MQQDRLGRIVSRVALAVALTALAVAAATSVASAQKPGTTNPKLKPVGRTVGKAEVQKAKSTPISRVVRLSKPLKTPTRVPVAGKRKQGPDGPRRSFRGSVLADGTASSSGAAAAFQNTPWTGTFNTNPNRQVGRLNFWTGTRWSHCTATAINSENKSLVVTAGHCVFSPDPDENGRVDGNGRWHTQVSFCPGYESSCRLGVWYSRGMWTTNSWYYGTNNVYDWADDVAVVLVSPNASGRLVDSVGGQGITFNQATGLRYNSFGYPASDSRWPQYTYSGQDLIYCPGNAPHDGYGHLKMACTMTGGASGGPWIISPNAQWLGWVNSVNSHKPWGGTFMGGAYFGNAELNLFQYARAR